MEFLLDTVNLDELKDGVAHMPIAGVTSNPSIVKKTAPKDFFAHMREVRKIIGKDRSFHIQVVAEDAEGIVREAHRIFEEVDDQVYIKIPTSYEGVRAMKMLKEEGRNVTATAVYTDMQAYMALAAGADYIAPYYNRIGNLGGDPDALIRNVSARIDHDQYDCKIVAASFHALSQVEAAINNGAQAVTVSYDVLKTVFTNPNIAKAVHDFNQDWYSVYGEGKGILDL
jgi:TalC/MipB family fructose-6-phosphate aldolase